MYLFSKLWQNKGRPVDVAVVIFQIHLLYFLVLVCSHRYFKIKVLQYKTARYNSWLYNKLNMWIHWKCIKLGVLLSDILKFLTSNGLFICLKWSFLATIKRQTNDMCLWNIVPPCWQQSPHLEKSMSFILSRPYLQARLCDVSEVWVNLRWTYNSPSLVTVWPPEL